MSNLIQNILSLEDQAEEVLASAHVEAEATAQEAKAQIRAIQEEVAAGVEKRVAAFREEAERRHGQELEEEKKTFREDLASIADVPSAVIEQQVQHVMRYFREL